MSCSARRVLLLHVVVAAVVGGAACTAGHVKAFPPVSISVEATTTSSTVNFATIPLGGVPGHTVTTVVMGPGTATLNGTVTGPSGPVGGADVHVERVVNGFFASADVGTQADGTWTLPGVLGGQFRVRAWRTPDLTDPEPALFYLSDGETKSVGLQMASYTGTNVTASIAPNPPIIDESAQLVVQVTTASVDNQGVVRAAPKPGSTVQLFGSGHWTVQGPLTQTTVSDGDVAWELRCTDLGPQPLSVVVDSADVVPLSLPPCSPVPPTTTTVETTTTVPGRPTTTRRTTTTQHNGH